MWQGYCRTVERYVRAGTRLMIQKGSFLVQRHLMTVLFTGSLSE